MSTFEIIQELCRKEGITITALEKELGFGRGSIGKLKKGISMSSDRLKSISDRFGISLEYLTTGKQPDQYYLNPETARIAQEVFDNPDLRMLFDAARDVEPDNIRLAAEMLKRFKETNKE